MDETPVFDQLVREWRTPLRDLMGRHSDADGDGVADQGDPDTAVADRAANPEPWCEDRDDPDSWDDPAIHDAPHGEFAEDAP